MIKLSSHRLLSVGVNNWTGFARTRKHPSKRGIWVMTSAEEHLSVLETIAFYSGYAGQLNASKMIEVFTPNAVLTGVAPTMGLPDPIVGAEAIRDFFAPIFQGLESLQQLSNPYDIRIEGDAATARTVITEFAKLKNGPLLMMMGEYYENLVRTPHGWRFNRRELVVKRLTSLSELPLG